MPEQGFDAFAQSKWIANDCGVQEVSEPKIYIIGIGDDGLEGLTAAARQRIQEAELLLGTERALASVPPGTAERIELGGDLDAVVKRLQASPSRRTVVLASGDPASVELSMTVLFDASYVYTATKPSASNHGPVRVANEFHFAYADGTPFRQRVWQAIHAIPSGRTLTYGELARKLNSAPRAVGGACGDNRIPLVIPCHRVVASGGIGGFMHASGGDPIAIKQWLLRHERAQKRTQKRAREHA